MRACAVLQHAANQVRKAEHSAKQADELFSVEVVLADHGAVQEKNRNIQAVTAHQLGIPVHVYDCDGG
jgi:2-keto-4-pentenoate hydratase